MLYDLGIWLLIIGCYFGLFISAHLFIFIYQTIKYNIEKARYLRKWRKLTRPYSR